MRLSSKHPNGQIVEYKDFSGGLNTSNASQMIAENELSRAVNVEIDRSTGLLVTVSGTRDLYRSEDISFQYVCYDNINQCLLVTDSARNVYTLPLDGTTLTNIGMLSGEKVVSFASWESGVLVASGGKMQYYAGGATLTTLTDSPAICKGVWVSTGRVITFYDDRIHLSAIGDETNWTEDTNDASSSKWLDVGYKDGGFITDICSLGKDLVIFKSNSHVYHLSGDYPDWVLSEVSRNVLCKCTGGCSALANTALAVGRNSVFVISPTDTYTNMRADTISGKVTDLIADFPASVKVRYVVPLNQVWFINSEASVLFFDATTKGFYQRKYNSALVDVCNVDSNVVVLKEHSVCVLDNSSFVDDGTALPWEFRTRTIVSYNDYLVKRVRVDVTPLSDNRYQGKITVGLLSVETPMPATAEYLFHDYSYICHSKRAIKSSGKIRLFSDSSDVYDNIDEVYGNTMYLCNKTSLRAEKRCVQRLKAVRVAGKGRGGRTMFNLINFEIAEV